MIFGDENEEGVGYNGDFVAVCVVQQVVVDYGWYFIDGIILDVCHQGKGDFYTEFFGQMLDGRLKVYS